MKDNNKTNFALTVIASIGAFIGLLLMTTAGYGATGSISYVGPTIVENGATDLSVYVHVLDKDGDPCTALTVTSFDVYAADMTGAQVSYESITSGAVDSHADNTAFLVGNGTYVIHLVDAVWDAGVKGFVTITVKAPECGSCAGMVHLNAAVDADTVAGATAPTRADITGGDYALDTDSTGKVAPQSLLVDTTIASFSSQTVFVLTAGSDVDDTYLEQAIVLYDVTNNDYPSIRMGVSYVGSTKTLTLDKAPDFTLAASDKVKIFVSGGEGGY